MLQPGAGCCTGMSPFSLALGAGCLFWCLVPFCSAEVCLLGGAALAVKTQRLTQAGK